MGKAVLVTSLTGSDRVPLVTALSLIMLDPFYRTIDGLRILIEREFINYGHQFKTRLGHGLENAMADKAYIPIFIMFLDCVYQFTIQHPFAFEFNQKYLRKMAVHAQTLKFGNFVSNSEMESIATDTLSKTISIWSYIDKNNKREKYMNIFYDINKTKGIIRIEITAGKLRVWKPFYMKWIIPSITPIEETSAYMYYLLI